MSGMLKNLVPGASSSVSAVITTYWSVPEIFVGSGPTWTTGVTNPIDEGTATLSWDGTWNPSANPLVLNKPNQWTVNFQRQSDV
jgi:hypothetical protein